MDARYGATNQVTFQLGSDYFWRDTLPDKWHPYALVSIAPGRAFSVTAEGVPSGLGRARADYIPTPDLRVSAIQTWFDTSDPAPIVGSLSLRNRSEVLAFWRPAFLRRRLFFDAGVARATSTIQTTYTSRLASTLRLASTRVTAGVRHEWAPGSPIGTPDRTRVDGDVQSILRGPWDWTRSMLLRGTIGVERRRGVVHLAMGVGHQIKTLFRIDVDATWDRGQAGVGFGLVFTSVLPSLRAVSRNRYREGFGIQGTQSFEGSVLWNRYGQRAEFGNGRALGRAGVTGAVFFDANANGKQDPEEQGVAGVRVRVGTTTARTDSLGWFSVKDLVPFEATPVEIDTISIDNQLWIPAHGPGAIHPTPNSYQLIELPLLQAGEVVGQVVSESGSALPGATVLLRHVSTNDTTQVVTFSDGTSYTLGVRPGPYEATVSPTLLQRLNATSSPARFVVGSLGTDSSVDDVVLRVVRN